MIGNFIYLILYNIPIGNINLECSFAIQIFSVIHAQRCCGKKTILEPYSYSVHSLLVLIIVTFYWDNKLINDLLVYQPRMSLSHLISAQQFPFRTFFLKKTFWPHPKDPHL